MPPPAGSQSALAAPGDEPSDITLQKMVASVACEISQLLVQAGPASDRFDRIAKGEKDMGDSIEAE